jgi:hypothetical protein
MDRFVRSGDGASTAHAQDSGEGIALGFDTQNDASALMLELVLIDGSRVALPYVLLTAAMLSQEGELTMEYPDRMVRICGRNLLPLYQHILVHLARRVSVSQTAFDDGTASTWVSAIEVDARE